MTDRPIIFSAPMIRALLVGAKTQTRRILKPQPSEPEFVAGSWLDIARERTARHDDGEREIVHLAAGDRLWVRENFSGPYNCRDFRPGQWDASVHFTPIHYWADGDPRHGDWTKPKPSIHMPRWASRITLTVTDVKIERLQDISEADARAESVQFEPSVSTDAHQFFVELGGGECCTGFSAVEAFADLWHHIHGVGAWAANPWVVAVSFRPELRNIDLAAPS